MHDFRPRRSHTTGAGIAVLVVLLLLGTPGTGGIPLSSRESTPAGSASPAQRPLHSSTPGLSADGPVTPTNAADVWQNATPGSSTLGAPPPVAGGAMAWDPTDGELVFFGGGNALHPQNQTWVYLLGHWINQTNYGRAPPAEFGGGLDFDYGFGAVLLFGGCGQVCPTSQTWSFVGGLWTNRTGFSFSTPPARYEATMAYANDSSDEATVLFGGCLDAACSTRANDTWVFNQTIGWVPAPGGPAPSPRSLAASAFSPGIRSLVLFGGCGRLGCGLNDTWLFHAGSWLNYTGVLRSAHNPSPPGVGAAQGTYDGGIGAFLLFGGTGRGGASNQTWSLTCTISACAWANRTDMSGAPPGIDSGALASESTTYAPVLFGGYCTCVALFETSGGTWVYEPLLTSDPTLTPTTAPARTSISAESNVAGGTSPYNYAWSAGASLVTTANAMLNFSEPGNYSVRFSVSDRYGVSSGSTLTEVATGPLAQALVSSTFAEVGESIAFSTPLATGGTSPYAYNWTFGDGSGSSGPTVDHRYSTPGGYVATLTVTDALGLENVTSASLRIVALPTVSVGTFRSTIDAGGTVTFASAVTGGIAPFSFAWRFGSVGTSTLANPTFAFASVGRYLVNLTVTDAHDENATASTAITVNAPLSANASVNASALPAFSNFTFSTSVSGGSPPITYQWAFGDGTGSISATPLHAFASAGNFTVRWWVNDSANGSVHGSIDVKVLPGSSGPGGGDGPNAGGGTSAGTPLWDRPELWIGIAAVVFVVIGVVSLLPPKHRTPPGGPKPAP